jgi:predicted lipid-binding transport protein (Tim44 family)
MYRAMAERLAVEEVTILEPEIIEEMEEMEVTTPEPAPVERALVRAAPSAEPEPEAEPPAAPPPRSAPPSPARQRTPSAWLGYAGLTAAALLGGLLGALLALLVIGGINGTLDFGQAEAVVSTQAELERLNMEADTLQTDLDGLRQRLEDLEGLTSRVDSVEQAVGELDRAFFQTQAEVDALKAQADQLSADIAAVRASAERFDTFLDGLRDLLFEFQGAPPSPTPTLTPLPTVTPRPTRTPRPSPTPTGTP